MKRGNVHFGNFAGRGAVSLVVSLTGKEVSCITNSFAAHNCLVLWSSPTTHTENTPIRILQEEISQMRADHARDTSYKGAGPIHIFDLNSRF